MENLNEIWVIEYSATQGEYHLNTLEDVIDTNLRAFLNRQEFTPDYVIIGAAGSHREAHEKIAALRIARQK